MKDLHYELAFIHNIVAASEKLFGALGADRGAFAARLRRIAESLAESDTSGLSDWMKELRKLGSNPAVSTIFDEIERKSRAAARSARVTELGVVPTAKAARRPAVSHQQLSFSRKKTVTNLKRGPDTRFDSPGRGFSAKSIASGYRQSVRSPEFSMTPPVFTNSVIRDKATRPTTPDIHALRAAGKKLLQAISGQPMSIESPQEQDERFHLPEWLPTRRGILDPVGREAFTPDGIQAERGFPIFEAVEIDPLIAKSPIETLQTAPLVPPTPSPRYADITFFYEEEDCTATRPVPNGCVLRKGNWYHL